MTLTAFPGPGPWFPNLPVYDFLMQATGIGFTNAHTMDAAGERMAMIGTVYIDGRPGSAKTISSAGGKIHWMPGSVTFADAGTSIDVGLQNITTTAGPSAQPDDAFDVSGTLVGGTDTITANAMKETAMESGSMSVAHGDLIGIVLHMTARGGTDSVIVRGMQTHGGHNFPLTNTYVSSWGATAALNHPIALIEFDDGTFGVLDESWPMASIANTSYDQNQPNDEFGGMLQVPAEIEIDAFRVWYAPTGANADHEIRIWSDPTGTPSELFSYTGSGEHSAVTSSARQFTKTLATGITLAASTDYGLSVRANSGGAASDDITMPFVTVGAAGHKSVIWPSLSKIHRDGDTGAFTETDTQFPLIQFRISKIHDGAGGGGGGFVRPVGAGGLVG